MMGRSPNFKFFDPVWGLFILFLCVHLSHGLGSCGFPGLPDNANVSITFDAYLNPVAHYQCPGSFVIDGDVTRRCKSDGTWTGMLPRCAVRAANTSVDYSGKGYSRNFMDNRLQTCDWFYEGNSFKIRLNKRQHINKLTLISPKNYKDFKKPDWMLEVTENDKRVKYDSKWKFNDKETVLATDEFCSVQWHLHGVLADAVRLTLRKGRVLVCEASVHTVPDECGKPESPVNGHVKQVDKHSACKCDAGFKSGGNSSVRSCFGGRWDGHQCTCQLIQEQSHKKHEHSESKKSAPREDKWYSTGEMLNKAYYTSVLGASVLATSGTFDTVKDKVKGLVFKFLLKCLQKLWGTLVNYLRILWREFNKPARPRRSSRPLALPWRETPALNEAVSPDVNVAT